MTIKDTLTIYGYQWRDKEMGNNYFTWIAYADGEEIARNETMEYGSGDHYVLSAWAAIQESLGIDDHYIYPWEWCESMGVTITTRKFDVKRKRDLKESLGKLPR